MKIFTKKWEWGGIGCFALTLPADWEILEELWAKTSHLSCEERYETIMHALWEKL